MNKTVWLVIGIVIVLGIICSGFYFSHKKTAIIEPSPIPTETSQPLPTSTSTPRATSTPQASPTPTPSPKIDSLDGKTYRLTSYNGTQISADREYRVAFLDGSVNAKFCNNMGGVYTLNKGIITSEMMGTLVYCESGNNVMEIEQDFSKLMGAGATVSQQGNQLTLSGTQGIKMVFYDN